MTRGSAQEHRGCIDRGRRAEPREGLCGPRFSSWGTRAAPGPPPMQLNGDFFASNFPQNPTHSEFFVRRDGRRRGRQRQRLAHDLRPAAVRVDLARVARATRLDAAAARLRIRLLLLRTRLLRFFLHPQSKVTAKLILI
jgi:hypothetical protein